MNKKKIIQRLSRKLAIAVLTGALLLSGCNSAGTKNVGTQVSSEILADSESDAQSSAASDSAQGSGSQNSNSASADTPVLSAAVSTLNTDDQFSKRDLKTDYDESECILITLSGDNAVCESENVVIEGSTVIIKAEGSYLVRGTLQNGSIRVDAPEDAKVQLILDGAQISCETSAAIYAKEADKVFITLSEGSTNTITNTGDFEAIDDNNITGAIFSKCDLTINGTGSLIVSSVKGSGIVSKDDLVIAGGTYVVTAGDHGISGKDSIRIADGNLTITSVEDGLHSGNEEDADKGYIYIAGGTVSVSAGDDGIHGESKVVIADGIVNILESYEGIEAAVIEIAGGTTSVVSSDDGLNATDGSGDTFGQRAFGGNQSSESSENTSDIYILISGGRITVDARGDGVDSNGYLYVKGGETYISGPENDGNGAIDYEYGSEITGGTLVAVGSTGMAMNLGNATQGTALLTTSSAHEAGEKIELLDQNGNVLISYTATCKFRSVVVSCPSMKQGETYTLVVGNEKQEFTLDELVYGKSNGFGGFGGGPGGFGGRGNQGDDTKPEGGFQKPDGDFQKPEGFDGEGMPDFNGEGMPNFGGEGMPDFNGEGMPNFGGEGMPDFNGEGMPGFGGRGTPDSEGKTQKPGSSDRQEKRSSEDSGKQKSQDSDKSSGRNTQDL